MRNRGNKQNGKSIANISIITLNVNGLYMLIKRQRLAEWIKNIAYLEKCTERNAENGPMYVRTSLLMLQILHDLFRSRKDMKSGRGYTPT